MDKGYYTLGNHDHAAFQERLRLYLTICRLLKGCSKNHIKLTRSVNLSEMENGRRTITFPAILRLQPILLKPAIEVWYHSYKGKGAWSKSELKKQISIAIQNKSNKSDQLSRKH